MPDRASGEHTPDTDSSSRTEAGAISFVWSPLTWLVLIVVAVGVGARAAGGARYDALVIIAAVSAAILFVFRPSPRDTPSSVPSVSSDPLKLIFDSAGPMVVAIALDGTITNMNPAAERLMGYHAAELVGQAKTADISLLPAKVPGSFTSCKGLAGSIRRGNCLPRNV